jgi:hypothetical protein
MPAVMTKVQLIGRKPRPEELLGRLYELRSIQLLPAGEEPKLELMAPEAEPGRLTRASDLRLLIGQVDCSRLPRVRPRTSRPRNSPQ